MPTLTQTIPALPVRDVVSATVFYRDRLGFEIVHHDGGFVIVRRDEVEVHLWQADDEKWRDRDTVERPVRSGAESFLAGTASCRVHVEGIDALFAELEPRGVLHSVSHAVETTDYGTREFHAGDEDGKLVTFFERSPFPRGAVRDAIERADLAALRGPLAPEVVWVGVYPGQICRNREQVVATLELPENAARSLAPEIVAEQDDKLVVDVHPDPQPEWVSQLHQVIVVDVHPDPQPEWVSQLHQVIVVSAHGEVLELRDYADRAAALAALGDPW